MLAIWFYLLGGAAAALAHILTAPGSQVPAVGASGAVAAALRALPGALPA